jgi:hypothetical protein
MVFLKKLYYNVVVSEEQNTADRGKIVTDLKKSAKFVKKLLIISLIRSIMAS